MTEIAYEDKIRRLRVSGRCAPDDATAVREAVEQFGRAAPLLTVDLTAADMAPEVATSLVDAVRAVEAEGCRTTLLRKCDSGVDRLLRALGR